MMEIYFNENAIKNECFEGKNEDSLFPNLEPHTLLVYSKNLFRHENYHLTQKQVNDIFSMVEKSYNKGIHLNRFITISLKHFIVKDVQNVISGIMEKTRKWLQRNGYQHAHIWVLENGGYLDLHAHILIHIPPNYLSEYKGLLNKWLPEAENQLKHDIKIKTVKYPPWGELGRYANVYGLLRYMCKGVDPSLSIHGIKPKFQGEILGRRCGYSSQILKNNGE